MKRKTVDYYELDEAVFRGPTPEDAEGLTGDEADLG